ncbi:hypothetical protein ACJJTC_002871 [Scirpophaga incertulas]
MIEAKMVRDVVEETKQVETSDNMEINKISSEGIEDVDSVSNLYDPTCNVQAQSDPPNVKWNDMFDFQLFPINTPEKLSPPNRKEQVLVEIEPNTDTINIPMDCDTCKSDKIVKRKNSTKLSCPEKKMKQKTKDIKNIYRKEKSSKTVKKWLKDIDQSDLNTADEKDESDNNDNIKARENELDRIPPKVHNKKKEVQTQLANKDGILKFNKPLGLKAPKNAGEENNTSSTETLKEKKTKIIFTAPVKSQIPIKDITYDIYELSEDNIDECVTLLSGEDNPELLVVLVFRNGLCQLSKDYMEDSENMPDSIIIYKKDVFFHVKSFEGRTRDFIFETLKKSKIICFDGKNILIFLLQYFNMRPFSLFDAKIGAALLDPDNIPHDFLGLQRLVSCTPEFTISSNCPLQKAAWYTVLLQECASKLKTSLLENSLWKVFEEIEMKLVPIIAEMERHGVHVDCVQLSRMEREVGRRLAAAERACVAAAGRPFQPSSPAQVRALLYGDLRLDRRANFHVAETIATGAKSTSEPALRALVGLHPLPALILQYRHLQKAHATFLAGIEHHVREGIVRPKWVQIAAATGRIACNNPNLQSIPKVPFQLNLFPESEDSKEESLSLRSAYTSGGDDRVLLAADFRQVECRVWAHAAGDARLAAAIARHDDVFRALAAHWLKKPESEVCEAERERTKRVVYGQLYGAGKQALARALAVPYGQALDVAASFQAAFPSLRSFGPRVVAQCEADRGRVWTSAGRCRVLSALALPASASASAEQRARAARQAVNYVVQGSAADVCKLAMIATDERIRALALPARLVLQLHDELLWEVDRAQLARVAGVVQRAMEQCGRRCALPPLPAALAAGPHWARLLPLPLPLPAPLPD